MERVNELFDGGGVYYRASILKNTLTLLIFVRREPP
jgi:hypothetical protein